MSVLIMSRSRAYRLRRLYVRVVRAVWRFVTAHQEFIMALILGLLAAATLSLVPVVGPALATLSLAAAVVLGWVRELRHGLSGFGACGAGT